RTGQYVPETVGEIVRCIYESLAMKYRQTFEKIKSCTGKDYEVIHVIGGGVKDTLLCGMTASSCERAVMAGPIEATVFGNISVGLLASGAVKSIAQAREIVKKSDTIKEYTPGNTEEWRKAYEKFLCVTGQNL
ncbi:MAG: rhamnulokinase, partial [Clostridiales bacterium]|nr:rhamnulokinase [Clostridiales bacterium]